MCYTDGPHMYAREPELNQITQPDSSTERKYADMCRVGDPTFQNIFYNVSVTPSLVANPWSQAVPPLVQKNVETVVELSKTVAGSTNYWGDDRKLNTVKPEYIKAASHPYKFGHASCAAIRTPKNGVSRYNNIEARPWPDTQPILRSFVSPTQWDQPPEVCRKEVIEDIIYSHLDGLGAQLTKCTQTQTESNERWFFSMAQRNRTGPPMHHHTCHVGGKAYVRPTLSLPVAGLLDILKTNDIAELPAFNVTVSHGRTLLDLMTDSSEGVPTLVNFGAPYEFELRGESNVFGATQESIEYKAYNLPSWLTLNGTRVSGTAPSSVDISRNVRFSAFQRMASGESYFSELGPFDIHVVRETTEFALTGSPRARVHPATTYEFVPRALNLPPNAVFYINNKPEWASFDETTGRLNGNAVSSAYNVVIFAVAPAPHTTTGRGLLTPVCNNADDFKVMEGGRLTDKYVCTPF